LGFSGKIGAKIQFNSRRPKNLILFLGDLGLLKNVSGDGRASSFELEQPTAELDALVTLQN